MRKSKADAVTGNTYTYGVSISQRELEHHYGATSLELYNRMRHAEAVTLAALNCQHASYEDQVRIFGSLS